MPESLIDQVSAFNQIEYVEKPKRLFFAVNGGKAASCLLGLQPRAGLGSTRENGQSPAGRITGLTSGLTGRGVLTAVVDSGIDYFHPDFRNEDGTTRCV